MRLTRNILIVDDETRWLRTINMVLNRHIPEAQTFTCENSRQVIQMLSELDIALVLLDLNMPGIDGRQLLRDIREQLPHVRIVVITGLNETEVAVECMKQGAYDFIAKTSTTEQLLLCIRRALEVINLERNYHRVKDGFFQRKQLSAFSSVLTNDAKMIDCIAYAATLSESREPIFIEGESGSGKRHFAKAISQYFDGAEVMPEIDLALVDITQLNALLCGDEDEIGILSSDASTLLFSHFDNASKECYQLLANFCRSRRFFPKGSLREHSVECRFIFTSTLGLETLATDKLSSSLHYRLQSHRIKLPSLAERNTDIGLLLQHFTEEACNQLQRPYLTIDYQLALQLSQYAFPGNIAELRALVYHAVSISGDVELNRSPFLQVLGNVNHALPISTLVFPEPLPTIREVTSQLVHEALKRTNNNQSAAAKLLGITQSALSRRLSR